MQFCTMKFNYNSNNATPISLRAMLFATVLVCMFSMSHGQKPANSEANLNLKDGIAIKGYDAVAYFNQGKAVKGDTSFSYQWQHGKWLFANQKNLQDFSLNPEKYAPQFGGFCAYGASRGYKADTDPQAFTVVGEKLYLNYNLKVKEEWLKDTARRIQLANAYWNTLQ